MGGGDINPSRRRIWLQKVSLPHSAATNKACSMVTDHGVEAQCGVTKQQHSADLRFNRALIDLGRHYGFYPKACKAYRAPGRCTRNALITHHGQAVAIAPSGLLFESATSLCRKPPSAEVRSSSSVMSPALKETNPTGHQLESECYGGHAD